MTARSAVRTEVIGADHATRRLDNVLLTLLKGAPRSLIYKLLRSGQVRVNGRRSKPDYRVAAGDRIRIPPLTVPDHDVQTIPSSRREQLEAAILYEDERILVLNKPSGLASHGGSGIRYGVIEILRTLRNGSGRLDLGHRLDRETSGCLVLCKDLETLRYFHQALRERHSEKRYIALLRGHVPPALQRIDAALGSDRTAAGERRTHVDATGKQATTVIEQRSVCGDHTLVTLRLETGRMHQIRAHARHIGHPVAGDRDYGDKQFNREMKEVGLNRLFLHAAHIAVATQGLSVEVNAPLPGALQDVLARLRAPA